MIEIKKIYTNIIVYLMIIILLFIGLFIVNKNDIFNKSQNNYILKGNIDYNVISKNNSINSDNQHTLFVASTVDNIIFKFDYKFNIQDGSNMNYRYEIISSVVSNLDDSNINDSEVFRKDERLVTTEYMPIADNGFVIQENISTNYDYYNNIALVYDNSVNIPVKSKYYLTLNIYIKDKNGEEQIFKPNLYFELEKNTFNIQSNKKSYEGNFSIDKVNYLNIIFNLLSVIIILVFLFLIVYNIYKYLNYRKSHYLEFKYKKIMKDYSNVVVPINKIPKDNNIVTIKVLYFKSMIDIQHELHLPILCYKSDKFIIYMIINNKLAYIYFLNSSKEKI